jgi:peptidoglycan hydrolase-like protein with peptidoglycan-binding domain
VRDLQSLMLAYGAPSAGLTDGLYGPTTEKRWKELAGAKKQAPGIARVNGTTARVVRATLEWLRANQPKAAPAAKAPAPAPAPAAPGPTPPAGFDRAKAAKAAPNLAKHIVNSGATKEARKKNYSRPAVREFQRLAGLTQDGMYGRGTAAAVRYYAGSAPEALYTGGTDTYAWGK